MILNSEFEIDSVIPSGTTAIRRRRAWARDLPLGAFRKFRLWQGIEKCRVQNVELRVDSLSISHLPKP